jgi:alpha-beta hydrolase superfamily lysophospholipase
LTHTRDILPDMEAFRQQVIEPELNSCRIRDLTLCGISLGGVVATVMATQHPDRYSRLVLLAPAYKPHRQSFTLKYTLKNIGVFLLRGAKAKIQIPYGLSALTSNEALLNDPEYNSHPPLTLAVGYLLGVSVLCWKALRATKQISIPTLMVIPGKDIICDPNAMRTGFQQIPNSTTKVCREYPDFYHDVLFESGHPEMAEDVLAWIHQLEQKTPLQPEQSQNVREHVENLR